MENNDKPLSAGALNVASLIQTLLNVGIKSTHLKEVLGKIDNKEFKDSQLTKLKKPSKYNSVFSEDTLKKYHEALKEGFQEFLDNITSPYELLKGWYQVNTFAYLGRIISHTVKIDIDQTNQLCMYWDWDDNSKEFNYNGIIKVRGTQLFIELTPNYNKTNLNNIAGNRTRYLIMHCGLFDKKIKYKQVMSGIITRLRSNSSEIIAYSCLFIKLDKMLSGKMEKPFDVDVSIDTPIERVLKILYRNDIEQTLEFYRNIYFDARSFRDKEKKHCLTVSPLENYSLNDILQSDIYLKERSETEKLAGLYMTVCNIPSDGSLEQFEQKRSIGYLFIYPDSTVKIKTDNYYYKGSCIIYVGTNILEIRAEAYVSDSKFEDFQLKTEREFTLLMTFSLGDSKSLDFKWIEGVSVAVSQDNSPIALHEILVKLDKYYYNKNSGKSNIPVYKEQLVFFEQTKKEYFNSEKGREFTDDILKFYNIIEANLMLNYIKAARESDTTIDRGRYSYNAYLNSFYGGIYKLENAYNEHPKLKNEETTNSNVFGNIDLEQIDYEAQILFRIFSDLQEAFKHGFKYDLLDTLDKKLFDKVLENISLTGNTLNKYFNSYLPNEKAKEFKYISHGSTNSYDIFKSFPTDKDKCKIRIIEMTLAEYKSA